MRQFGRTLLLLIGVSMVVFSLDSFIPGDPAWRLAGENATPVGMRGEDVPFHAGVLSPRQFVLDTVYHPAETPLLAAARARGVPCANGLGMLVHQAALAFELWTGETAPLAVMLDAARADDS